MRVCPNCDGYGWYYITNTQIIECDKCDEGFIDANN